MGVAGGSRRAAAGSGPLASHRISRGAEPKFGKDGVMAQAMCLV
jgi:hypothetical protein